MSIASIYEKDGDAYYSDYKFRDAMKNYEKGKAVTGLMSGSDKLNEKRGKLDEKRRVALKTGASWLENRVRSYCDQAEYLNLDDKPGDAKAILKKAGWVIAAHDEFLNKRTKKVYDSACRAVGFDNETIIEDVRYYEANRDNNYGMFTLIFGGSTAAFLGAGYYFNIRLPDLAGK